MTDRRDTAAPPNQTNRANRANRTGRTGRTGRRRVVLVTGGGGAGIGSGVCQALAADGWHVAVSDLDGSAATAVAAELTASGLTATGYQLDVRDEPASGALVARIGAELGPVEGLVNSAGVGLVRPAGEVTPAEWDRLHSVDLRGTWLVTRAVLPGMVANRRGAIVNVGSVHARGAYPGYAVYAAAKAGLVGLTRGVAADYGRFGIRCSVVHPGLVDSPQNREQLGRDGDAQAWMDAFVATRQLIPEPVRPHHVGAAVAYLLSDAASAVTGVELMVDAGSSAMAFDHEPGSAPPAGEPTGRPGREPASSRGGDAGGPIGQEGQR